MASKAPLALLLALVLALAAAGPASAKSYDCTAQRDSKGAVLSGYPTTLTSSGACRARCDGNGACLAYKNTATAPSQWRCTLYNSRATNAVAFCTVVPPPPPRPPPRPPRPPPPTGWTCRTTPKTIWPPSQDYMNNVSYLYDRYTRASGTNAELALRCRNSCVQFGAYNGKPCLAYILTADLGCYLLDQKITYESTGSNTNFLTTCNKV